MKQTLHLPFNFGKIVYTFNSLGQCIFKQKLLTQIELLVLGYQNGQKIGQIRQNGQMPLIQLIQLTQEILQIQHIRQILLLDRGWFVQFGYEVRPSVCPCLLNILGLHKAWDLHKPGTSSSHPEMWSGVTRAKICQIFSQAMGYPPIIHRSLQKTSTSKPKLRFS